MTLYHGSNVLIDHIDLSMSKPNKDFGKGFYLTDIREQALEMAYRRCRFLGQGEPVVTSFSFDEALLENNILKINDLRHRQMNGHILSLRTGTRTSTISDMILI